MLTGYLMHATQALDTAKLTVKTAPDLTYGHAMMKHWQGVVSGINWMIAKLPQRQSHLWIQREMAKRGEQV